MPFPIVYTPNEAMQILKIGRSRFYTLLREGKIKAIRNGRRYLIPEACITTYIESQTASRDKKEAE